MFDELNEAYDLLVEYTKATAHEIHLVTTLYGYNQKTLDNICYYYTGYRSVEDFRMYLIEQGEIALALD